MIDKNSEMYSEARDSYDFTNHLMSFYTDSMLRHIIAKEAIADNPRRVLDLGTGTGDSAIMIAEEAKKNEIKAEIIALDANKDMINTAKRKAKSKDINNLSFEIGDALNLKYPSNYFDVVTCTFALKNFGHYDKFTKEVMRVLKKDGKFVLLDISRPLTGHGKIAFYLYYSYMKMFAIATNKKLYRWLPGSTREFDRTSFMKIIKRNNFLDIRVRNYLFGIAYILICKKRKHSISERVKGHI